MVEERSREEIRAAYVAQVESDCAPFGGAVDVDSRLTWAGLARHAHARRAAGAHLDEQDLEALRRYPVCPRLDGTVSDVDGGGS